MTKIIFDLSEPSKPGFKWENVNATRIYTATLDAISLMSSIIEKLIDDKDMIEQIRMSRMHKIMEWTSWVETVKTEIVKK